MRLIDVATLDFPLLRTMEEFAQRVVPVMLKDAAEAIKDAEHIVFVFPLWLGTMPALLKGKTGRVVVIMGMPAFFYRFWYLGHGIAGMCRNILNFVGISPVGVMLLGMAEEASDTKGGKWIYRIPGLGRRAS